MSAIDDAAALERIALLNQERERVLAAQVATEEQYLHGLADAWREGALSESQLALAFHSYSECAAPGYRSRWGGIVPVPVSHARRALTRALNGPNMPDGTWRGPWPLGPGDPVPPAGTCVVYVLYDATAGPCYVGSSQDLRARLRVHQDEKVFTHWTASECTDREAAYQLEERMLAEYQPYLNRKRTR